MVAPRIPGISPESLPQERQRKDAAEATRLMTTLEAHEIGDIKQVEIHRIVSPDILLTKDEFGNAVMCAPIEPGNGAGKKWVRRPMPDTMLQDVLDRLGKFAASIASGEDGAANSRISALDAITVEIECKNQDDSLTSEFRGYPEEAEKLIHGISAEFAKVSPPIGDSRDILSHVACIKYAAGAFLGDGSTVVMVSREAPGPGAMLVHERLSYDGSPHMCDYRQEVPLTSGEWDAMLDSLVQAEVLDWDAIYENRGVRDGMWQTFELAFDDGWKLLVTGNNHWDRRFLPIAKELMRYGLDERDLLVSLSKMETGGSKMETGGSRMYQDKGEDAISKLAPEFAEDGTVPDSWNTDGKEADASSSETVSVAEAIQKMRELLAQADQADGDDDSSPAESDFVPIKKPIAGP